MLHLTDLLPPKDLHSLPAFGSGLPHPLRTGGALAKRLLNYLQCAGTCLPLHSLPIFYVCSRLSARLWEKDSAAAARIFCGDNSAPFCYSQSSSLTLEGRSAVVLPESLWLAGRLQALGVRKAANGAEEILKTSHLEGWWWKDTCTVASLASQIEADRL